MDIQLRPYQAETIDVFNKSLDRGIKRNLAVLSTGLGKTFLACFIVKKMNKEGKKCIILVERKILAYQWKEALHQIDPSLNIGIEMNVNKSSKGNDVVIASLQTLGAKGKKRIKKFDPNQFDFCITDEADRFITKTGERVLNYFGFGDKNFNDKNALLGLTATGRRHDGKSLGKLFDDVIVNYDLEYGQTNGWLTHFDWLDIDTGVDISKVKKYGNKYVDDSLDEAVNIEGRNELIVKSYLEQLKGKSTIVYCVSVQHAYNLKQIFNHYNVSAEVIEANTKDDDRSVHLDEYEKGNIDVLLNHSTLTIGYNSPQTKGIMLTREFGSAPQFVQTVGRGVRTSPDAMIDLFPDAESRKIAIETSDKPHCTVLDFQDHDVRGKLGQTKATLYGLNPKLVTKTRNFYKDVVEPIKKVQRDHGIDPQDITDINDINLIVKNRKLDIKSLKLPDEISNFTDRTWVDCGDGYEIIYGEDHKALIIEKEKAKSELIDKEEWNLLEYDTKKQITKNLQTFNSLSGAFKVADQYADEMKWSKRFLQKEEWQQKGVTEGQLKMLTKFYTYRNGHSKFKQLSERYPDTNIRQIFWVDSGEILDRGDASKLINAHMNKGK